MRSRVAVLVRTMIYGRSDWRYVRLVNRELYEILLRKEACRDRQNNGGKVHRASLDPYTIEFS